MRVRVVLDLHSAIYYLLSQLRMGGYVPPDTQGAAGPTSYVETVNQTVALYGNKATGTPASVTTVLFWRSPKMATPVGVVLPLAG